MDISFHLTVKILSMQQQAPLSQINSSRKTTVTYAHILPSLKPVQMRWDVRSLLVPILTRTILKARCFTLTSLHIWYLAHIDFFKGNA